jgi:hypothetical protein
MAKSDLGRTIIDELKLCYSAEFSLLSELSNLDLYTSYYYDDFLLFRIEHKHYEYCFRVSYCFDSNVHTKIAVLCFGLKGTKRFPNYVYYEIANKALYNNDMLKTALKLPNDLRMVFNHITSIDLARDYKYDVVKRIRKFARRSDVKINVNGKKIDKNKDCDNGHFVFPLNFKRLSNPTINIKQAKAKKNKNKGLTLSVYNKSKEIVKSHKEYIKEFYGNPKSLHRIEVHQNNDEIKRFCKNSGIKQVLTLIFNQLFLDSMFNAHLSSLLRFTKGRTKIEWDDFFNEKV